MIVFSVIIPHKNTSDLLFRCVNSIPERDDLEVIVIDDNSDEDHKSRLSSLSHSHLVIIEIAEGRGAGYARNQGLKQARGQWLIFADADDWFTDNFDALLNQYAQSEADVIYFRSKSALPEPTDRIRHIDNLFDSGDERTLRYGYITPWGKFIKRALVEKKGFRFDEIRWSNDAYFMTQVGVTAQKVLVSDQVLYIVDEVEGSLTHTKGHHKEETICRTKVDIRCFQFAESKGFSPSEEILFWRCTNLIRQKDWFLFLQTFHSLPERAKTLIENRLLFGMNPKAVLFYKALFNLSYLVPQL